METNEYGNNLHRESTGWYIDDVRIEQQQSLIDFAGEGFESGWGRWTAGNGVWEVGRPTVGPRGGYQSSNCVGTVLGGNYPYQTDSRLISPEIDLPSVAEGEWLVLGFWQWFSYARSDTGSVQIQFRQTNGWSGWTNLQKSADEQSPVWSHAEVGLSDYAGQRVRIAFYHTDNTETDEYGSNLHRESTGWYIDDVRILAGLTLTMDFSVVRTQTVACLPLRITSVAGVAELGFTLQTPPGHFENVALETGTRFSSVMTSRPSSNEWSFSLRTSETNALAGDEQIGYLCFTPVSTQSVVVYLTLKNVTAATTNIVSINAVGSRARVVIIADQPLLEAWLGTNQQRMLTLYGKADTTYDIRYAVDPAQPSPWNFGWTNLVPGNMFYVLPLEGSYSNAPILFLRANER